MKSRCSIFFFSILILAFNQNGCVSSPTEMEPKTVQVLDLICADDYLQDMLEKLPDGETLVLENREYCITESLWISEKENITLKGQENTSIVSNNLDYAILYLTDTKNLVIDGIKMKHKTPPEPEEYCSEAVIRTQLVENIVIKNSELNGSGRYGVELYRSKNVIIENNKIHNNSNAAFRFIADNNFNSEKLLMSNIVIRKNHIYNNPRLIDTDWPDDLLSTFLTMEKNNIDP